MRKKNGIVCAEDSRKSEKDMIYCEKVGKDEKMSYRGLSNTELLRIMLDMKECAEEMVPVLIKQKEELEEDICHVKTKTGKYILEKEVAYKEKGIKHWKKEANKYNEKIMQLKNK